MPGPWDDFIKLLVRIKPDHLVSWILQRAYFKNRLSEELKVTIYADGLFLVEQDGHPMLVHLEAQSKADKRMRERLQEYNVLASREHDYLPVYSCVLYLRANINVAPSPLIRKLPDGTSNHRFDFAEIELADIPAEQIVKSGLSGLFPLAVLAKGGTQAEIIDTIANTLAVSQENDLLALAYALGSIVFPTETAKEWYKRRFRMFEETIRDTWVYQEIGQERFEKGLEIGGSKALREAILDVIQDRFPDIEAFAKKQIETIQDPMRLRKLNVSLGKATTIQEATRILLDLSESNPKA